MHTTSFVLALALITLAIAEYPTPGTPAFLNDNNVLQYALTLENLEATFYTNGLLAFSAANFSAIGLPASVYPFLTTIRDHEIAHVNALSSILTARGATPVTPCNYTFTYTNIPSFLATAAALERTGVSAYDGAISSLVQTDLVTLAAGVATVEARHSAYLNLLTAAVPFPNVTDVPATQTQIFGIAGAFFNGTCAQLNIVAANPIQNATMFRNVSSYNQTVFNQTAAYLNDNNVLQYALTLENLEAAFYSAVLSNISAASFAAGGIGTDNYAYIQLIQAQEVAHVGYLTTLLTARGATPVAACSYQNIYFPDSAIGVQQFIQTAIALEAVGTSAYIGAASFLTDEGILTIAAAVATVEARHTSYLRALQANLTANATANLPFPNVVDPGYNVTAVATAAAPFFTNLGACLTFDLPVSADLFRPNQTAVASSSSSSSSVASSSSSSTRSSSSSSSSASSTSSSTRSSSSSVSGSSSTRSTSTQTSTTSDASMKVVAGVVIAALALAF